MQPEHPGTERTFGKLPVARPVTTELTAVWADAPRHAPDAPFPTYRFVPGRHPHPRTSPVGSLYRAPEPLPGLPAHLWREDASYLHGVDLYHHGYLWEAHECWEACLDAAQDGAHRDLLQALVQLAAAVLNAHLGKTEGVAKLTAAVLGRLETIADDLADDARIAGLDVRALASDVRAHFGSAEGPAPRLELG